ncbi:hypothetical protein V6N11_064168 [Hibiscus sabdariffa]|uniref:Uncharacterized protein n=1 Tax=Hibiscus sabdariffa TaxID=183260 RepID=A0ABR2PMT0_9ROSI
MLKFFDTLKFAFCLYREGNRGNVSDPGSFRTKQDRGIRAQESAQFLKGLKDSALSCAFFFKVVTFIQNFQGNLVLKMWVKLPC